ncbi:nuclear transport factor 2 family protein [Gilvimarinus sp. SDUM040013]|uniref:Nuclear transport factor 2 family protein n=1 Tax=Gilvimarinus gilvus TaxID=3058038 RepID=A0ABU4S6M0_9GAMM|nr:nuclear transport factor 2 family protein [Gilvimarinus sp. SDUM040013]MDO3384509.1 nuclear transport factor 2 family protein [Gilvimarinus sp. SDUM040013]MDX6851573.1 nuclear transport factor 2 family protein [Gilvimarinus sp. SDUM040013]
MKHLITLFMLLVVAIPCFAESEEDKSKPPISPQEIVDVQLSAYNDGDIKAFVSTYADDVKTYGQANDLKISGIKDLENAYAGYFEAHPELHAEVTGKIIQGNFIIYQELVSGVVGGEDFVATAIYEVRDDKIQNVWFFQ